MDLLEAADGQMVFLGPLVACRPLQQLLLRQSPVVSIEPGTERAPGDVKIGVPIGMVAGDPRQL
jgi:hypothetical protein